MIDNSHIALLATFVLGAQCCFAAYLDCRYRKLPNAVCLSVLVTGLVSGIAMHDPLWVGLALAHGLIALIVGIALFAARIIGGGDAKFYAAVAAWLPLASGFQMLSAVALCGFLIALAWFPLRRRIAAMAPDPAMASEYRKVPFGLAIAIGGWLTFALSANTWSAQL